MNYEIESDSFLPEWSTYKVKCFVNVIPVLFIGFSQFYWVYKAVVRAAGGGLTLTLNSPPLSLHCQLFAMSLPDICRHQPLAYLAPGTGHCLALPRRSRAWQAIGNVITWLLHEHRVSGSHSSDTKLVISSSANFIATFSFQKLTIWNFYVKDQLNYGKSIEEYNIRQSYFSA